VTNLRLERLARFSVGVPDVVETCDALRRLGIDVTSPDAGDPAAHGEFRVGTGRDRVAVRLVDGDARLLGFAVDDLASARDALGDSDVSFGGCDIELIAAPAHAADAVDPVHAISLARVDHLAAIPPDLDAATRSWVDVLGVPVHDEIRTPDVVIRQMKVGDLVVELLAPTGPDSPLAGRPSGLLAVVACEVPDAAAAAAVARGRGFRPTDPAPGALPGTLVSRIDAAELGGLGLQLLQYV